MYLSVGVVLAIILVLASLVICPAWWLLVDLGERVGGSQPAVYPTATAESRRRAV